MAFLPTLYTPRLCLRPFKPTDAKRVQELAGDRRIAAMTARIPHPYPDGQAEAWIASQARAAAEEKEFTFAITLAGTRTPGHEGDFTETGHLVGAIGLTAQGKLEEGCAELGYWVGVPYWNKGFATEAAHAVLSFGFNRLDLHRVTGCHLLANLASGRVLQKLHMKPEGTLREHLLKDGEYHDLVTYGVLRHEWQAKQFRLSRRVLLPRSEVRQVAACP